MKTKKLNANPIPIFLFSVFLAHFFLLLGCGVDVPIQVEEQPTSESTTSFSNNTTKLLTDSTTNEIFQLNPRTGEWQTSIATELKDDDIYLAEETLYLHRDSSTPTLLLPEVTLAQLAAAQAAWDPDQPNALPTAHDVVFLPGDHFRFTHLHSVEDGDRFAFQGRLFEARRTPDDLHIRPTGQTVHRVAATFHNQTDTVFDLHLEDSAGHDVGRLTATAEHPFYLPDTDQYRPLAELTKGDRLLADDGSLRIVRSVTPRDAAVDVFNFEVQHAHNYFVRPDDDEAAVLVHNVKRRAARAAARGRSIDDIIAEAEPLPRRGGRTTHLQKSGGFDQANADFNSLNLSNINEFNMANGGIGRVGTLPDGTNVVVRSRSSENRATFVSQPTLEIQTLGNPIKIRY